MQKLVQHHGKNCITNILMRKTIVCKYLYLDLTTPDNYFSSSS